MAQTCRRASESNILHTGDSILFFTLAFQSSSLYFFVDILLLTKQFYLHLLIYFNLSSSIALAFIFPVHLSFLCKSSPAVSNLTSYSQLNFSFSLELFLWPVNFGSFLIVFVKHMTFREKFILFYREKHWYHEKKIRRISSIPVEWNLCRNIRKGKIPYNNSFIQKKKFLLIIRFVIFQNRLQFVMCAYFFPYTFCLHVFFISNQVAKAQGLKLGQKLSNHLSNPKGLNQSP